MDGLRRLFNQQPFRQRRPHILPIEPTRRQGLKLTHLDAVDRVNLPPGSTWRVARCWLVSLHEGARVRGREERRDGEHDLPRLRRDQDRARDAEGRARLQSCRRSRWGASAKPEEVAGCARVSRPTKRHSSPARTSRSTPALHTVGDRIKRKGRLAAPFFLSRSCYFGWNSGCPSCQNRNA
jgi:hypothetical protein